MTTEITDIDTYIAGFPKNIQEMLEQVRNTVRKAALEAEEAIKYGMPTLVLNSNLVHFAAFKNHIGFYPVPSGIEAFKEELSHYKGAKGSVQFPIDKPLPLDLIVKITTYRVGQNIEKANLNVQTSSKSKKRSDQAQVTNFIQKLDPDLGNN